MEDAMDMVHKRERKSLQERKRVEWQKNWEALDIDLAKEMDILMELVHEPMDVTVITAHSEYMEQIMHQDVEMEYHLEDEQMELETYEDWL